MFGFKFLSPASNHKQLKKYRFCECCRRCRRSTPCRSGQLVPRKPTWEQDKASATYKTTSWNMLLLLVLLVLPIRPQRFSLAEDSRTSALGWPTSAFLKSFLLVPGHSEIPRSEVPHDAMEEPSCRGRLQVQGSTSEIRRYPSKVSTLQSEELGNSPKLIK